MVDAIDATILVALATLVLAVVSYAGVRQNKRQVDILARQTAILRSQQDPILVVNSFTFAENTLHIRVVNQGIGPTSSLAVDTSVALCRVTLTKDASLEIPYTPEELESAPRDAVGYAKYDPDPLKRIIDDGRKKRPVSVVNHLLKQNPDSMTLLPKEEHEYAIALKFGLGSSRNDPDQWVTYDGLVEMLKKNGTWAFVLGLGLLGKNMAGDNVPGQKLAEFIVDFARHKTLAQAFNDNIRPRLSALDRMEVAKIIPLSTVTYLRSRFSTS